MIETMSRGTLLGARVVLERGNGDVGTVTDVVHAYTPAGNPVTILTVTDAYGMTSTHTRF